MPREDAPLDVAREVRALRNELTAILGFCTIAQRSLPAGHPVASDLAHVHTAAEQAADVVRRLFAPA